MLIGYLRFRYLPWVIQRCTIIRHFHPSFNRHQLSDDATLSISPNEYVTSLVPKKIHPGLESILANANKPIILRDYQEDAAEAVLSKLANGVRKPAVVIATGGGKTIVFSHLIPRLKPLGEER